MAASPSGAAAAVGSSDFFAKLAPSGDVFSWNNIWRACAVFIFLVLLKFLQDRYDRVRGTASLQVIVAKKDLTDIYGAQAFECTTCHEQVLTALAKEHDQECKVPDPAPSDDAKEKEAGGAVKRRR